MPRSFSLEKNTHCPFATVCLELFYLKNFAHAFDSRILPLLRAKPVGQRVPVSTVPVDRAEGNYLHRGCQYPARVDDMANGI